VPISLTKAKSNRGGYTTVEMLLDAAKTKLLAKLELDAFLPIKAWVCARRSAWILPFEPLKAISISHLFPIASKFCGEPVNHATYATARRALLADHDILMEAIRVTEPTTDEIQEYYGINNP